MKDGVKQGQLPRHDALRYAANLLGGAVILYGIVTVLLRALCGWFFTAFSTKATLVNPTSVPPVVVALCNLLLTCAGLLAAIWFLRVFATGPLGVRLCFADPRNVRLWLFLPVFLGAGVLCNIITAALKGALAAIKTYTPPPATVLPQGGFAVFISFLALCVAPAILEEILCRGFLQGMLRRWGMWFSVVVSSVAFTLLHSDIAQMPSIFVLSVLLGLTAYATNSLLPGIVLHFCNNTVAFILLYMQQNLTDTAGLGTAVYLMFILLVAAAVCLVLMLRWRLFRALRPVPTRHNPANRQKRVLRLARAPLYIIVMIALALHAVWPLLPFGKGA